jgi:5'-3' exoribonuclease 2
MAVLSPYSISAIPENLRPLMEESSSEIIDFYPLDFKVDTKGKRFAWMGEVILPFIDEERLLKAIERKSVGEEEMKGNELGECYLYINKKEHGEMSE